MEKETLILLCLSVVAITTIIVVAIIWYCKFKIKKKELEYRKLVEQERERTKELNNAFAQSLLQTNKEIIEVYCKNNTKQKE
ncbi:hypothetical protein HQ47_00745 [Porphyromonas macacae]|uniref:Uncharacterized protein n=1 Tax=Porphyromonas macacae TaxID=28115 RepID=A0A0A2EFI5_9PORP|nr:hypothetical protein [Porphyromonas macacae]KGN76347.1 hypothetical protein HQ47_00745 [Porphyromonas macacae]